jgi:hypothetical protein
VLLAFNLDEPFDQHFLVKLTKELAVRGVAAAPVSWGDYPRPAPLA